MLFNLKIKKVYYFRYMIYFILLLISIYDLFINVKYNRIIAVCSQYTEWNQHLLYNNNIVKHISGNRDFLYDIWSMTPRKWILPGTFWWLLVIRLFCRRVTSVTRVKICVIQDFAYYLNYSKLYARYFHIYCNMLKQRSIIFLLFCVFFEYGTGLYFHIGETERKCFIEEIPDETKVLGKLLL